MTNNDDDSNNNNNDQQRALGVVLQVLGRGGLGPHATVPLLAAETIHSFQLLIKLTILKYADTTGDYLAWCCWRPPRSRGRTAPAGS